MDLQLTTKLIIALSALSTSLLLLRSYNLSKKRKELAMNGDENAARLILLPCYAPMFRGLMAFYFVFFVLVIATINIQSPFVHYVIIQFYFLCILTLYSIIPVFLIQPSVSYRGMYRVFFTITLWWIMTLLTYITWIAFSLQNSHINFEFAFRIIFNIFETLPPLILTIGIFTKNIKSRVQLKSSSNRNLIELLLTATILQIAFNLGSFVLLSESNYFSKKLSYLCFFESLLVSCLNFFFPFAMYRTLHADTKFWRGLGKHNQGGIRFSEMVRQGDISAPTIDLNIVSSSFQDMIHDLDNVVDFAFLDIDKKIGDGATAEVYKGKFKQVPIAIKISSPPEITVEVLQDFAREAKACDEFQHKNVIKFYGICVRPPQIGMIFELCDGSLKSLLHSDPKKWTEESKFRAVIQASRAIAYVHRKNCIHRDIKTDNFFVKILSNNNNANSSEPIQFLLKLGDFGEVTHVSTDPDRKMTILGTVAYMAPELIAGKKQYNQSIDVYALGMTIWEIFSGHEPYEDHNTFAIYRLVSKGVRPDIPAHTPTLIVDLIRRCWEEDPSKRPSASEMVAILKKYCKTTFRKNSNPSSTASLDVDSDGVERLSFTAKFLPTFKLSIDSFRSKSRNSTTQRSLDISRNNSSDSQKEQINNDDWNEDFDDFDDDIMTSRASLEGLDKLELSLPSSSYPESPGDISDGIELKPISPPNQSPSPISRPRFVSWGVNAESIDQETSLEEIQEEIIKNNKLIENSPSHHEDISLSKSPLPKSNPLDNDPNIVVNPLASMV